MSRPSGKPAAKPAAERSRKGIVSDDGQRASVDNIRRSVEDAWERRTALTGRHTHFHERRGALYTLLANTSSRLLPLLVVRPHPALRVVAGLALLAWWYVPHWVPAGSAWGYAVSVVAGVAYGIFLAGFVPMGAIMPENAPDHRGAAMAMYTTAAGGAFFLGSAVVAVVLGITGALDWSSYAQNSAVIWTFVALYACAFVMVGNLRTQQDDPEHRRQIRDADTASLAIQAANNQQTTIHAPVPSVRDES